MTLFGRLALFETGSMAALYWGDAGFVGVLLRNPSAPKAPIMIISHTYKYFYIGIPRTGSKSMNRWLMGFLYDCEKYQAYDESAIDTGGTATPPYLAADADVYWAPNWQADTLLRN